MSVATELTRIQTAKANLKASIEAKGVTVSSDALIDAYPALVDSIPTGGGAVREKLLNFIDYDGTIVASYEGSEIAGLTSLPDGPDHSTDEVPLTFEGWNETLSNIKAFHTSYPDCQYSVFPYYHTTDGKCHIYFDITSDTDGLGVYFTVSADPEGTVDWGDGTIETISSRNLSHIYTSKAIYHCVVDSNIFTFNMGDMYGFTPQSGKVLKMFLPSGVTGTGTTQYCNNLEVLTVPNTVASTISYDSCFNLKTIVKPISSSATSIASNYYQSNYSLKHINIPSNATSIGSRAFSNCYALKSIAIPSSITSLGTYCFNTCTALKHIYLPNTITQIPDRCFAGCSSLAELTLPSGTTSIGTWVFSDCKSLQTITIPSTVTSIGNSAFSNCSSMYSVTVLATTPPTLGTSVFNTNNQKKIYVPYSADHSVLDEYKAASNWSNFASIMEEIPQ